LYGVPTQTQTYPNAKIAGIGVMLPYHAESQEQSVLSATDYTSQNIIATLHGVAKPTTK